MPHRSAGKGHEAAARLLLEKGADVSAKDSFEKTELEDRQTTYSWKQS